MVRSASPGRRTRSGSRTERTEFVVPRGTTNSKPSLNSVSQFATQIAEVVRHPSRSGEGGSGRKRPSAAGGNDAAGKRREPLSSHGLGAAAERHAVVAIDVGHHGTGWAYGWKGFSNNAENVRAFALNDHDPQSKKEPTCVLLDERDVFVAFGDKARRLAQAPGQDLTKIKFFENFKMDLNRIQNICPSVVPSIGAEKQPVPVRTLFKVIFMEIVRKACKRLDESPGAPVR